MAPTHSTPALHPSAKSTTVVIHCSDPRYQPHFQHFLREGLGLSHYALIAVPGGAHFLTLVEFLPKFSWAGWRWMKFMVDLTKTERIVLIAHDDCRWYLEGRFSTSPSNLRNRLVDDLRRVRDGVNERFGRRTVELFYARIKDDAATFESV